MQDEAPTLLESFEYRGHFWLPSDSPQKVAGILSYSEEGIELLTFGALIPLTAVEFFENETGPIDVVYGESFDNTPLTLHILSINGLPGGSQRWLVSLLFVGRHLEHPLDTVFTGCELRFTNLEEWVGHVGFETDTKKDSDGNHSFTTAFSFPDTVEVSIPSLNASLSTGHVYQSKGGGCARRGQMQTAVFHRVIRSEFDALKWSSRSDKPIRFVHERALDEAA